MIDELSNLLTTLRDDRARLEEVRQGYRRTAASVFARLFRLEVALRNLARRPKRS